MNAKRLRIIPLLLFVTCIVVVTSASDRRMTIEAGLSIKQVGSPQLSSDGKWIVYTITEWDKKDNRRVSHIYLSSTDGGRSAKLTNGINGESQPQWSPDNTRIAFLADRDNKGTQVWAINAFGGESERITSEENNVQAFQWSPDGKHIAYVVRDSQKDKALREKKRREKFDTIVVDADYSYSHLWIIDLEKKDTRRLTSGQFSVTTPEWSPDGKQIAFVFSRRGSQESSFIDISDDLNTDIYIIDTVGGVPRPLTDNPAADSNPKWSPDGQRIAYISSSHTIHWAAKKDLMTISPDGSLPINLTGDFYESAHPTIQWSPDANDVYFMADIGVYSHIFKIASRGGKALQITVDHRSYGAFDIIASNNDTSRIVYLVSDGFTPEDIWTAPLSKLEIAKKITWANPELKDLTLAETNIVKWRSEDNFIIEGLLVKPLNYREGTRYPLIVIIHGGPYTRFTDTFNFRAQFLAASGYAILMPNPRGSTGYGSKFTSANIGDWGGKDFNDIMAGTQSMISRGVADPENLFVMGGSYGGFMTFRTITQTNKFKAAISHAGISDWYSFHGQSDVPGLLERGFQGTPWTSPESYRKHSPMTYVDKVKTPIMITHGENDLIVPITQSEQFYRALKKRSVEVIFLRFPREGHAIHEPNHVIDLLTRQLEWFNSHLNQKQEPKS